MTKKEYHYENNLNVMEIITDKLMMTRVIQEIEVFDKALQMTFLQMFPCASDEGDVIESMYRDYCKDYTVKEWYESLFKIEIKKR
tara:strand:- start:416 stop:670 length:255 start_codon:yes stop_codon:yes gene_type:complete